MPIVCELPWASAGAASAETVTPVEPSEEFRALERHRAASSRYVFSGQSWLTAARSAPWKASQSRA